ncbi:hypothetical protein [Frigoriglobus tundricola]|uniref:Uncharacterized protein n=1 Tax=Frigoriglobus tundricola TaxID=2774151 RepID=A0A6M5YVK6_9BACT|nr:hypothetical protein [Frigoriglobus tundricola]QJW97540.1 hypothetical protein FTUN_5115 [Frigoriglobus tundricola]
MVPRTFGFALALLAAGLPGHASQIAPLDLGKLAPQSELIVVGVVTAVSDSDAASDTISVQVISTLKGKAEAKSFSLRLRNKGVKDFDPRLAVGDQGVFFLKSIEGGRAELTYWGSIAVIPKKGNFRVPSQPNDGSDPFREYAGKEPLPEGLRAAYTGFVRAAKGGGVEGHLLPGAVQTSSKPRPKGSRDEGNDINEDFLTNGFSPLVRNVRKEGNDCYLIRTDSTAIGFVQNKSGAWRVYRYADKPID